MATIGLGADTPTSRFISKEPDGPLPKGAGKYGLRAHQVGGQHGADGGADEALPGLLGGELNERRAAEEEANEVGGDVVDDDECHGEQEPEDALVHVGHREAGLGEHHEQDHVRPRVLPELVLVQPLLQAQDERDRACTTPAQGRHHTVWALNPREETP
jgi:hypothetical protein